MDGKPYYEKIKQIGAFPLYFWESPSPMLPCPLHWHEQLEIMLMTKGAVDVFVDGKFYECKTGDILIITPNKIHGLFDPLPDSWARFYQIGLDVFGMTRDDLTDKLSSGLVFERRTFFSPPGGEADAIDEWYPRIKALLDTLFDEYEAGKDGFRTVIKARLCDLAMLFLREIPVEGKALPKIRENFRINHQHLERVLRFIQDHVTEPVTLEDAARAAHLSKFYFTRFFKVQMGMTFHAYLSRLRVNQAERHLAESDLPINDIAFRCGFNSLKTFNRLFKIYTGKTPSAYRT